MGSSGDAIGLFSVITKRFYSIKHSAYSLSLLEGLPIQAIYLIFFVVQRVYPTMKSAFFCHCEEGLPDEAI